jgi:aquaporin Z
MVAIEPIAVATADTRCGLLSAVVSIWLPAINAQRVVQCCAFGPRRLQLAGMPEVGLAGVGRWAPASSTPVAVAVIVETMQTATTQPVAGVIAGVPATDAVTGPRSSVKYAVEAIGTFFLVFTVGAAVGSGSPLAPLGIGAVLMVMIYAGGHLSGGHYNPAVTMAVLVRRRITLHEAAGYWVAQLGAGLLAAVVVRTVVDPAHAAVGATMLLRGRTELAAFVVELLFTFALCYVVLNVATSKDHRDNSFYGLAIGFTVVAGAVAVGAISGGAFNPAVTLGAAVMGMFAWSTLWVYLVAQVLAGTAAGLMFLALNREDR